MTEKRTKVIKTDAEWRAQLTPEQYQVTRAHGTERPCSGPNWNSKTSGLYRCVCCNTPLFHSDAKYESGTGWPSFWTPVDDAALDLHEDVSFGMVRTEVRCATCDAHLGHVFPDGPPPTGQRYCMNGVAMVLEADSPAA